MTLVYLDGELLPESEARVSVFDRGLVVGDGVFETLLVRRGRPFAVARHLARLERSAAGIELHVPRAELEAAVAGVAAGVAGHERARLRLTVTGGAGQLGSARTGEQSTLVVAAAPLAAGVPGPAAVALAPWPRNERGALAGLKTTSYAENVRALAWARERGSSEALFGNTVGDLCEGTGSNVFVVVGGALVTPPLSAGALAGVTRDLVLELVDCVEKDVPLDRLADGTVEEMFLTSTTRGVHAVSSLDGRQLARVGGPLTSEAAHALEALMERTDEP